MSPLAGFKFGTTHLSVETEADVRTRIRALGGEFQHVIDANTDFLLVGRRWVPKYAFALTHGTVLLDPAIFFAALTRWRSGEDFENLKISENGDSALVQSLRSSPLQPLAGVLVCCSNLNTNEKDVFKEIITAAGGIFSLAMTAKCDVLVTPTASGRKYDGARKWKVPVVVPKWVTDSVKFGAALDPETYDISSAEASMEPPQVIPRELKSVQERPHGVQLKRKHSTVERASRRMAWAPSAIVPPPNEAKSTEKVVEKLFSNIKFGFSGFDSRQLRILRHTVRSWSGEALDEPHIEECDFMVVNSKDAGESELDGDKVITEWAIERSLYFMENALQDVWGRPVRMQPSRGFAGLRICLSGFAGIEERHATLLIGMLGATFMATLTADREVLVAESPEAQKVRYAKEWRVPVVGVQWLWCSAVAGDALPLSAFELPGVPLPMIGVPKPKEPKTAEESRRARLSRSVREGSLQDEEEVAEGVSYDDDDAANRADILRMIGITNEKQ